MKNTDIVVILSNIIEELRINKIIYGKQSLEEKIKNYKK